ncbi:hypothetical protein ACSBR1_037166 [Camellia fascicularis]
MDGFHLDVRFKSKNMIRTVISMSDIYVTWAATFIYASLQRSTRRAFWDQFKNVTLSNKYPWVCIGDFNEIGWIEEKERGAECRMSQLQRFQELLSACTLMDLEFKGAPFTWSNNQRSGDHVRKRLDRVVATVE